ncbi:MAG: hypothetical protein ACP5QK_08315 [Myxococcota bacterium]
MTYLKNFSILFLLFLLFPLYQCSERDTGGVITDVDSTDSIVDSTLEDIELVDASMDVDAGLPKSLPFEIERQNEGEPLTDEEITEFTKKLMNFYKTVEFGKWLNRISHGVHKSTGYPDYAIWWHDVDPIKEGDTVIWHHGSRGGAHNTSIPTTKVLGQMIAGYLLTGDEEMGFIADQYMKGLMAFMKGMVYDENDPYQFIMSRNIVTFNHSYTIEGNKKKVIDYKDWYYAYESWNAQRFEYKHNPFWGDVWVTNMRSKDDVPHIYRATAYVMYMEEMAKSEDLRRVAEETHYYIRGFTKDIVDSGYYIRTKDKDGKVYIPTEDLASFVTYEFMDKYAECNAKLATTLIAYSDPKGINCRNGGINAYEKAAVESHYYNLEIVSNFHLDSQLFSLIKRQDRAAKYLTLGIIDRIDTYMAMKDTDFKDRPEFPGDMAAYLFKAASQGVPLKNSEVRLIHTQYSKSIDDYLKWQYWDLWDSSIPDGQYPYSPSSENGKVNIEDMFYVFEYCFSPFKSKNGPRVVDCDIVKDRSRW